MTRKRRKKKQRSGGEADPRQVELLPKSGERLATQDEQLEDVPPETADRPETDPLGGVEAVEEVEGDDRNPHTEPLARPRRDDVVATRSDDVPAAVRPAGEQLGRARDLVQAGRIQDAIALYVEILAANPASVKAHNNLGVLLDELKEHESALEHFEAAERIDSDNVEVLTNLGSTLTALARYEAAEEAFRRAGRFAPEDPGLRLATGVLAFRRGMYAEAEDELRWVCARDPRNGAAFYYRGESLNRLGRFDEAATDMERAAELLPTDPRPFYTLGHLLDRRSERAEAAEMYRRARELQRSSGP